MTDFLSLRMKRINPRKLIINKICGQVQWLLIAGRHTSFRSVRDDIFCELELANNVRRYKIKRSAQVGL